MQYKSQHAKTMLVSFTARFGYHYFVIVARFYWDIIILLRVTMIYRDSHPEKSGGKISFNRRRRRARRWSLTNREYIGSIPVPPSKSQEKQSICGEHKVVLMALQFYFHSAQATEDACNSFTHIPVFLPPFAPPAMIACLSRNSP